MNKREFNSFFSSKLAIARAKEKLTQQDVAKNIGVSNNSIIGRYENGDREPNLYNLYKMMLLYNTDANYYFPIENSNTNNSIPIFTTLETIQDVTKIKKATDLIEVSSDLTNCFAIIVDNDYMRPQLSKNDIVIFEKTNDIKEDGVYLIKIRNNKQAIIRNIVVNQL